MGSKLTWFLCARSKFTWFSESGSNLACFCAGVKIDFDLKTGWKLIVFNLQIEISLVLSVGIEIDLVFAWGQKTTCFYSGDRLSYILCGWSNLAWFLYAGRKSLGLSVSIERDFVLSRWSILTWFHCGGSNFTWFQWKDKNWLVFYVGAENDLVFVLGSNLTWCKY